MWTFCVLHKNDTNMSVRAIELFWVVFDLQVVACWIQKMFAKWFPKDFESVSPN